MLVHSQRVYSSIVLLLLNKGGGTLTVLANPFDPSKSALIQVHAKVRRDLVLYRSPKLPAASHWVGSHMSFRTPRPLTSCVR